MQADVGLVYRDVRGLLKAGRKVLFSGTPCQVAGLYAVLGSAASADLFTVDIVCHGTPSVKVFEKYVREMEKTDDSVLDGINFRDKSEGWSGYALLHLFKSGKSVSVHHNRSKYMRLFLSRICQNVSCDECHYRKLPRIADITLGDLNTIPKWTTTREHPSSC